MIRKISVSNFNSKFFMLNINIKIKGLPDHCHNIDIHPYLHQYEVRNGLLFVQWSLIKCLSQVLSSCFIYIHVLTLLTQVYFKFINLTNVITSQKVPLEIPEIMISIIVKERSVLHLA